MKVFRKLHPRQQYFFRKAAARGDKYTREMDDSRNFFVPVKKKRKRKSRKNERERTQLKQFAKRFSRANLFLRARARDIATDALDVLRNAGSFFESKEGGETQKEIRPKSRVKYGRVRLSVGQIAIADSSEDRLRNDCSYLSRLRLLTVNMRAILKSI